MISLTRAQHAAPLQLHCLRFSGPVDRFGLVDQGVSYGVLEIQVQAAAIFFVQGEVDVLSQIRFERLRRQFEFAGGVAADFREMRKTEIARSHEVCGQLGRHDVSPCCPDCKDGWQACQIFPFAYYVVDVEQFRTLDSERGGLADGLAFSAGAAVFFDPYGNSQGWIANHERCVGSLQHGAQVRGRFEEVWGDLPLFGAEDAREGLGAAGTAVEREDLYLFDWFFGDDQEAAHLFLRGDGHIREDGQIGDALVFDGGNDGDVHAAGAQLFGALGGDGEGQIVFATERAVGEAPDERRGVQVLNDGDAKFRHGSRGHL